MCVCVYMCVCACPLTSVHVCAGFFSILFCVSCVFAIPHPHSQTHALARFCFIFSPLSVLCRCLRASAAQIWGHICTEWLRHAGNFQSVSTEQASDFALSRQREVEAEVDAALEMHDGRMKRIKEDVHDVRAAELMMHQHRVYRHSQAIEQELSEEKERAARLQQQLHREAEQFEKAIDIASGELASKRSRKELDMHREAIEDQYKGYRQVIRGALIEYRKALDGFLRRLKESNAAFRASFRSFTENGNFSSEEILHSKQVCVCVCVCEKVLFS